jgi:hypothetical protein
VPKKLVPMWQKAMNKPIDGNAKVRIYLQKEFSVANLTGKEQEWRCGNFCC